MPQPQFWDLYVGVARAAAPPFVDREMIGKAPVELGPAVEHQLDWNCSDCRCRQQNAPVTPDSAAVTRRIRPNETLNWLRLRFSAVARRNRK